MIPPAFQMIRGRSYSRKSGKNHIQMYYRQGVYIVKYGSESWGYLSYDAGLNHVIKLLLNT